MNSHSWRNDELGQLIRSTLHEAVNDASPSRQPWLNIKRSVVEQRLAARGPRRWPVLAVSGFEASLIVVVLLILISTLPWGSEPSDVGRIAESTTPAESSLFPAAISIDHPSAPSPIISHAEDVEVRRALATAVNRGVFEGTLKRSSSPRATGHVPAVVQPVGLARARD